MTKKNLLIWIPVAALVLNALGYLVVLKMRAPPKPVAVPIASPPTVSPVAQDISEERAKQDDARARRASGLAALEAGDYDKALIHFTEARALVGDKANVDELLRVTEDLRKHPRAETKPKVIRPPVAARPLFRAPVGRRVAMREEPVVEPGHSAASPPSGIIVVTTVPRGLLVHVDDTPVDLTPMRTTVKHGSHRVALLDGGRKIYETTVDVKDGATASIVKDLSAEVANESARSDTPIASEARAQEEFQGHVGATPARTGPAPESRSAATSVPTSANTGTLTVSSPGLYGVVWINGRPRGYPPLEARDVPVGPTKVEVRVNGVQKRSSSVVVQPGLTTSVSLVSLETAP